MKNRLQFVHDETIYNTREEAINHVYDIQTVNRPSLYGEPIVLKYVNPKDDKNPNIILGIGSVGNGEDASPNNKTFFIDIAGVNEKIEDIEEEIAEIAHAFALVPLTSDTIELKVEKHETGTTIEGNVKVPETVIVNRKEIDNIVKTSENGLYSYVSLTFDDDSNTFVFQVNDNVKEFSLPVIENGRYDLNTKKLVFEYTDGTTISVDVKDLARSWKTPESNVSQTYEEYLRANNLHDTSVILKRDEKQDDKDLLWADIRLASDACAVNNILERNDNGGLFVDGIASNILYLEDGEYITVQEAIKNKKTKVSAVEGNIITKKYNTDGTEEGIYASVDVQYDKDTNVLTFSKSDVNGGINTTTMRLNSTAFIDKIVYDSDTETLTIFYIDKDGNVKSVPIELENILDTWDVQNDGHNVRLNKNTLTPGKDMLSADVKVADKTNLNNNILENENHMLVVKGYAWNVKYTNNETVEQALDREKIEKGEIDSKISELSGNVENEIVRATNSESALQTELDATQLGAGLAENGSYITNLDANYINRATSLADADTKLDAQVKVNSDDIIALSGAINTNKIDVEDTSTVNMALKEVEGSANIISSEVVVDSNNSDNIIIKTENGLCATIVYDPNNNTITLSNGQVIQLTKAFNRIWYDRDKEALIIEYITASGVETVEIPIGEMIREWNVNPHNTSGDSFSSGVTLNLASSKTGVDILSAAVNISSVHSDNILSIAADGGLYVPEDQKVGAIIEGAGLKEDGGYSANTESNYIKFATSLTDADNKLDAQIKSNKDAIEELIEEVKTNKVDVEDTPSVNMTLNEVSGGTNIIKSDVNISEKEGNIITLNETSSIKGIYASAELGYNETTHIVTLSTSNGDSTINLSGLSNEWIVSNNNNNVTLEKSLNDNNEYELKANANIAPTSTAKYADNILENVELVTGKALYVSGSGITENKNNIAQLTNTVSSVQERLDTVETQIVEHDGLIDANSVAIQSEIERATNAENAIRTSVNEETNRATSAESALQSLVTTEIERAKSAESSLQSSIESEVTRATSAETSLNNVIVSETTRAQGVENSLNNAITAETATRISEDTRIENLIATEKNDRISADSALSNAIATETANRTTSENNLSSRIDNEVSARTASDANLRNLIAENTASLSGEVQRAIGSESAITESITTERTRAQGAEGALSGAIDTEKATRISEISRLESEIAASSAATTINVGETNTITLTKDAQNLVLGNVRLDNNTNGNILTTHTDGLYANVNLEYSAATNTLYYTVNGVTTPIVLNAGSIIDDISYNPVEKTLVITYKTAAGETRNATVGVADLIDVVTVQSGNHMGGIQLTSYTGDNGETVISAGTVISTDANNILVNDNGVLKVIGTADNIAYGNETVNSALNTLANGLAEETSQRKTDVDALSGAIDSITSSTESLVTEINNIETGAGLSDDGTYTPSLNANYISGATSLKSADGILDFAIHDVDGKLSALSGEVSSISSSTNNFEEELNRVEAGAGLTESGVYEPNLLANYISGATSLKSADELLDSAVKSVNDRLDDLSEGNPTYSTVIATNEDGNLEVEVKLSHSYNQQTDDIENVEVDNYSDITTDNLLRIIHVKDSIKEAKSNGLYFDGSIDYGEF